MNALLTRATLGMIALVMVAANVRADNYVVDPSHTSIFFAIEHMGLSYTYGRFNKAEGTFSLDKQDPAKSAFDLKVFADSIDTNDAKRDQHLRGPDFLDVKQFPFITFKSTSITKSGNTFHVTGDLTLHGVTKSVTIPFEQMKEGKTPYGKEATGFVSSFEVNRSEFGMTNMVGPIGDKVALTLSFEGLKQ